LIPEVILNKIKSGRDVIIELKSIIEMCGRFRIEPEESAKPLCEYKSNFLFYANIFSGK